MFRVGSCALVLLLAAAPLGAQTGRNSSGPLLPEPGDVLPRLIHEVEPNYTTQAQENHFQGTVVLEIVINLEGRAVDISVISPVGFGLDEEAQRAIKKWKFVPGQRAGAPVSMLALVEVAFRHPDDWLDEKDERRRSEFNSAMHRLTELSPDQDEISRAVQTILDLSRERHAPAMYAAGLWKINGEHGQQDAADGLGLIQKAASKNYGPALYEVALRRINGFGLPRDPVKGLRQMSVAATMGSGPAQLYLGNCYETGNGVSREPDRARRYYRLCAAQGIALCQYRLGKLLHEAKHRPERDYVQAVAMFQLAAEQGLAEAKQAAADGTSRLSSEQRAWVRSLKRQIARN